MRLSVVLLLLAHIVVPGGAVLAIDIFVSPDASDTASGGATAPVRTLEEALRRGAVARQSRPDDQLRIILRGGRYELPEGIRIDAALSGTDAAPTIIRGAAGEEARLSGSRRIEGFTAVDENGLTVLRAKLPAVAQGDWEFTQLFVNGRRASRTRIPDDGFLRVDWRKTARDSTPAPDWNQGQRRFHYPESDGETWREIAQSENIDDVEFVALVLWSESRVGVRRIDTADRRVTLDTETVFRLSDGFDETAGARYYLENVRTALDEPGEWYLDRAEGALYYVPRPGETAQTLEAIAPVAQELVLLEGSSRSDGRLRHLRFENLIVEHTEPLSRRASVQAAAHIGAALSVFWAHDVAIARCEVARTGTYAIEVGYNSKDITIEACRLEDLGAGGVAVRGSTSGTVVRDNEIRDGGRIFHSGVGVLIQESPDNRILHNRIADMLYTGVSVGWNWGYGASRARDNIVANNHIHHIGSGLLSDMGGVYTLGVSPGTRVESNVIHDIDAYGYGGWGIYLDQASTHITVTRNIVHDTTSGGFHQHFGRENEITNNIFAYGRDHQIQRTRAEDHLSFSFTRNVVVFDSGQLLAGTWRNGNFEMDRNLYWDERDGGVEFQGLSFRRWRRRGHDRRSRVADPLLDPVSYELDPGSPAFGLGFQPLTVRQPLGPAVGGPTMGAGVGPRRPVGPNTRADRR